MPFRCNICDAENELPPLGTLLRDQPSCRGCGSTVRFRALMQALSVELFGMPVALADFPVLKSVRGLGMSDNRECASLLAARFDYRSTFYDREPRFDVAKPATEEHGAYDFVLAEDVFEHVAPPVERALANVSALLKPGGFLALTVPYSTEATTREHFPEMHDYRLVTAGGHLALVNRTRTGEWQVFENLVFHGDYGFTLELRLFSEADLRRDLAAAGFRRIRYATEDYQPFGILHEGSWGVPVVAANEPFRMAPQSVAEIMEQHGFARRQHLATDAERLRLEAQCRELAAHLKMVDAELDEKSRWAVSLDEEVRRNRQEIARLQHKEEELTNCAQALAAELEQKAELLKGLQAEIAERTRWALQLQEEVGQRAEQAARLAADNDLLRRRAAGWEASRWSHLGRALGLGPKPS